MDIRSTFHYPMSATVNSSIFNWCTKMKKIIDWAKWLATRYIIGIIISVSFLLIYNHAMPISNWLTYASVEPLQVSNKIWDTLYMVSTRNAKRQSRVEWLDVLICKPFWRYSSYASDGVITELWQQTKWWRYIADTPSFPTECYIDSTTTLHLTWYIWEPKIISLKSKHFYFIY